MTITESQAHAWINRWIRVNAKSLEELRRLTPEQKLFQLSSLMASASLFERSVAEVREDDEVIALWAKLRTIPRDE